MVTYAYNDKCNECILYWEILDNSSNDNKITFREMITGRLRKKNFIISKSKDKKKSKKTQTKYRNLIFKNMTNEIY